MSKQINSVMWHKNNTEVIFYANTSQLSSLRIRNELEK